VGVSVKIFGLIRPAMLDDRGDNILPWTAFFIEHEHERHKYQALGTVWELWTARGGN
jgi:hypothetical protein